MFGINSCKKESNNPTPLPSKIADARVLPEKINAWLDKMPQFKPAASLLAAAQQAIINGVQVVRIPVGYNAALYFTKENDSLKVYAYKWRYQNLDADKYTGNIDAYNFQTQTMVDFTYLNGVVTNSAVLAHFGQQAANVSADGILRVSEVCPILTFLDKLWEWITEAVTDTSSGGGGSGGDFTSFMSSFGYSVSDYSNYVSSTGGGGNGIYPGMGGGITWGPPPCPPSQGQADDNVKLKVLKLDPNDPNNPPSAPGCVVVTTSVWIAYQDLIFFNNIDSSNLQPCMQAILSDVKKLKNGSVVGIIRQFTGNIPGYNWILVDGTLDPGVNAQTKNYNKTNLNVTTIFDSKKFNSASDLSIARTILHESVHAFLVSYFANDPMNAVASYSDMVTAWVNTKNPNLNDIQHDQMILDFMNSIALALMEFGANKSYVVSDPHFYSDMAWGGLITDSKGNLTSLFQRLVPNPTDQQRIKDTLASEQYQTDFYGNAKPSIGKKAGC